MITDHCGNMQQERVDQRATTIRERGSNVAIDVSSTRRSASCTGQD